MITPPPMVSNPSPNQSPPTVRLRRLDVASILPHLTRLQYSPMTRTLFSSSPSSPAKPRTNNHSSQILVNKNINRTDV